MYQRIATEYLQEIENDFQLSKRIFDKIGTDDLEIVQMINRSTIISMCIKYETFTSDLMSYLTGRKVQYNRPWAYTRMAASRLHLDITVPYKEAHDVWEYYNTLKHINHRSHVEGLKINDEHDIRSSWDALKFAHEKLSTLLKCFA